MQKRCASLFVCKDIYFIKEKKEFLKWETYKGGMTVVSGNQRKTVLFSNRALKRLIVPMIIEQFLAILSLVCPTPSWICNGRGMQFAGVSFGG